MVGGLALLAVLVAVPTGAAQVVGQDAPGAAVETPAASNGTTTDEARRLLREGTLDVAVLSVHASTLLESGDLAAPREVLAGGSEAAVEGVLQALKAGGRPLLVPEVLSLAATPDRGRVATLARDHLAALTRNHPAVVADAVAWLGDGARSETEARVLIDVLGRSRNMAAAPPLLNQLYGPYADAADAALTRLTGHVAPRMERDDEGASRARRQFWTEFWQSHAEWPRDEILDEALAGARASAAADLAEARRKLVEMQAQVVAARTELMGDDVDRLEAALSDPFAEVRRVAAERLANHASKQQAASAVPVMLARLRPPAENGGPGNGNGSHHGTESDPEVRAALVTALGLLGRNDDAVREALAAELKSAHPMVSRAAVQGLSFVRRHPMVVAPLLDYLDANLGLPGAADPAAAPADGAATPAGGGDAELAVLVLQTVAENQPQGVIPRVRTFLDARHPARVRAAAVRALLACEDAASALDQLAGLDLTVEDQLVRFNVALGLGARVLDLAPDAPARPRIVQLLGRLVDDADPSVRAEAAASLGRSGDLTALALLERRAQIETDPSVLKKIVEAFGQLRLREGVRVIGRICSPRPGESGSDRTRMLEEAAHVALHSIGDEADAATWLAFGDQLREVQALSLAAWCYLEVERRFSAAPEARLVVGEAKGRRARTLWDLSELDEARRLLAELHAAGAPHPSARDRLEMLASANERLGDASAAADWFLELLVMIQPGAAGRALVQRDAVRTLCDAQRWAEAAPLLDELIAADPSDNELLSQRARLEEGQGHWEQALATLQRLMDRAPAGDAALRAQIQGRIAALRARLGGEPGAGEGARVDAGFDAGGGADASGEP